jgi:hypothetical protein
MGNIVTNAVNDVGNAAKSVWQTVADTMYTGLYHKTPIDQVPIQANSVLGLPFKYTQNSDPSNRVWNNTIMENMPIVSLIPGRPEFLGITSAKGVAPETEFVKAIIGGKFSEDGSTSSDTSILNWLSNNFKANPDFRYYGFRVDYLEYFKYVQLMLSVIYVKMGLGLMYNFADDYAVSWKKGAALAYYFDKATSVTESADNSFQDSAIAGAGKSASNMMRELRFVLGKDIDANQLESLSSSNINQQVASQLKDITSGSWIESFLNTGGVDKFATILNGSNLLYPEIWSDSTFSRSYQLSFKFSSPYGDPASIFHHVYVPFISLLALCLPKQSNIMGYMSPFLVRADCPGYFTCDMGVITSLSYKKGGDDDEFTNSGLPLAIDVNITVKDLYPAMMMSNSYSMLATNNGIAGFLDNMAGIYVNDFKLGVNILSWIATRINYVAGIPTRFNLSAMEAWGNMVNSSINTFGTFGGPLGAFQNAISTITKGTFKM